MASSTYGSIGTRTAAYAVSEMLKHAQPIQVLANLGLATPLPKGKTDTVKWRRANPFPAATTPLTEGVTPVARAMNYTDVTAQLAQYGDIVQITDKVQDLAEDPVLQNASALCGEQAAETWEQLLWAIIRGGTNVNYANGSSRSAVNTPLSLNALRKAVRSLKAARAMPVTSVLSGSPNYATSPIEAGFIAVTHTDAEADIRGFSGFVPVAKYGSTKGLPYEIGAVEGVRIIASPVLQPFLGSGNAGGAVGSMVPNDGNTSNAMVYSTIVLGKEAFAQVALKGANALTPMVLNPGVPRGGDELGQRGTVGWKGYFAAAILNQSWMVRIEHAVTQL